MDVSKIGAVNLISPKAVSFSAEETAQAQKPETEEKSNAGLWAGISALGAVALGGYMYAKRRGNPEEVIKKSEEVSKEIIDEIANTTVEVVGKATGKGKKAVNKTAGHYITENKYIDENGRLWKVNTEAEKLANTPARQAQDAKIKAQIEKEAKAVDKNANKTEKTK